MRIFILPGSYQGEPRLTLTGKDYHYLNNVLRLKKGMQITARDHQGMYYTLTIEECMKDSLLLSCEPQEDGIEATTDSFSSFRGPFPEVRLYQGVGKGKKLEQIIRQCTELGISSITPLMTRYTVSDVTKNGEEKLKRYRKIVEEAIQQSGSPVLTEMKDPIRLEQLFSGTGKPDRILFFHQSLETSTPSLFATLKELLISDESAPISLVVGPEGGFSDKEVSFLEKNGARAVLMKTNILRTETAAVAAAAIILQYTVDLMSHS